MLNRVLLVDDSKSARFALRKLLERSGLQVDVAESAEQALGYLDTNHPDLIFMDHFMPGMDGFEAARAIKSRPDKSTIPIVMCTSKEGDEYAQEARENGAVDILPKPATPTALSEVLDNLTRSIEEKKLSQPDSGEESMSVEQNLLSEDQPQPEANMMVPTLEDVVVPVDKIREIATDSAATVVKEYTEQRLTELLESKVPQLREMVLENFDKVAKLILEKSVTRELAKIKEELKPVEMPAIELPEVLSEEQVDGLIKAQTHQLHEKMQREVNEQLAEIYSNIGELKSDQQLKKVSPELMEDILLRAKETATEHANETLLEVSEIAQKTAKQSAEEVSDRATQQIREELEAKQAKALGTGLETARQEASAAAWKSVEELSGQIKPKLTKLYILTGVSMTAAVVSLLGVIYLMS